MESHRVAGGITPAEQQKKLNERENCSRATEGPKEEEISRKWQTRRRGNTEEMVFVEEMVGMVYVYV